MSTKFFSNKSKENIILGGEPINKIIKDYKFRLNDFEPYTSKFRGHYSEE